MDDFYDDDDCYDMEDEEEDEDQVKVATFHLSNLKKLVPFWFTSVIFFLSQTTLAFRKLSDVKLFDFRMSTTRNRVQEAESWKVLKVKIEAKKIFPIFFGL